MRFDSVNSGSSDNGHAGFTESPVQVLCKAYQNPENLSVRRNTLFRVRNMEHRSTTYSQRFAPLLALGFQPSPELLPVSARLLRAALLLVLMGVSEDIQEYLFWAKSAEEDVWLRDDIAIAIRTVALAAEGCREPYIVATYEVLGCHPDHLQQLIEDRRRALLGDALYEAFHGAGAAASHSSDTLPPRKSPQPEIAKKAVA